MAGTAPVSPGLGSAGHSGGPREAAPARARDLSRRGLLRGSPVLAGALGLASRPSAAAGEARKPVQAALKLAGRTCALVMIDLQASNAGLPFQPHSFAAVVHNANVVAAAVRASGGLVAHTHVRMAEMLDLPADEPLPNPPPAPDGSAFAADAGPAAGDVVVTKRQWGAFYATDLDQTLRRRGIGTLLIGGVATEFGVESTVRDAYDRGYRLVFVEDAISGAAQGTSAVLMNELFPHMGHVRSSAEVVAALAAP